MNMNWFSLSIIVFLLAYALNAVGVGEPWGKIAWGVSVVVGTICLVLMIVVGARVG